MLRVDVLEICSISAGPSRSERASDQRTVLALEQLDQLRVDRVAELTERIVEFTGIDRTRVVTVKVLHRQRVKRPDQLAYLEAA